MDPFVPWTSFLVDVNTSVADCPGMGSRGSEDKEIFNFRRYRQILSKVFAPFHIPTSDT